MFHLKSREYYTSFKSDTFKVYYIFGKWENVTPLCFHSNEYFFYILKGFGVNIQGASQKFVRKNV